MKKFAGFAALTAAALLFAGCSSDGKSGSSTPPPSSQASSPPSSSAPPSSSSAPSSSPSGDLTSALLTQSDIGSGYTGGPKQSTSDDPLPCTSDQPSQNKQVPPSGEADAEFQNSAGDVQINEAVNEYSDDSASQRAYDVAVKGFDCSSGTISNTTIKIVPRSGTVSGVDSLKAWDFTDSKSVKGTAVAIKIGKRFVGIVFVAKPNAGNDVEIGGIVQKAVANASK